MAEKTGLETLHIELKKKPHSLLNFEHEILKTTNQAIC